VSTFINAIFALKIEITVFILASYSFSYLIKRIKHNTVTHKKILSNIKQK
jgi:hypothetical protein